MMIEDSLTKARCWTHQNRSKPLPTCHVCQRRLVEFKILMRAVMALLANGYALNTDNGGEERCPATPTTVLAELLPELMETDDEFLCAYRVDRSQDTPEGWVRFVYGNDGYDVISDYTTNLETFLAPVNAFADEMDPR